MTDDRPWPVTEAIFGSSRSARAIWTTQHLPITEQRDIELTTVKADEPTREQLYAAIKSLGEFYGATDA